MMVGRTEGRCNILDLHIIHAIKNGLNYYVADIERFKSVFRQISTTLQTSYFQRFVELNQKIQLDIAYSNKVEKFPLITFYLDEAKAENVQALGNQGINNIFELITQICQINIYAETPTDIRILHQLVKACLLVFKKDFLKNGYLDLRYVDSKDLEPVENISGEGVVVYNRQLSYVAQSQFVIDEILSADASTEYPWILNPSFPSS